MIKLVGTNQLSRALGAGVFAVLVWKISFFKVKLNFFFRFSVLITVNGLV